ncbi:pancreatic lipase-related protein 2-like isoform X3 [Bacillus rossius redtenbacheri]|uniref:pancreatic lipase-related protein 2-like isoform X3 n=1 Tax=Bacillus rossius redtenbacheri TaxID=93214 RepID=UPI002FDDD077
MVFFKTSAFVSGDDFKNPLFKFKRTSGSDLLRSRISSRRQERSRTRMLRKSTCYDMLGCFTLPHKRSPLQKLPDSPDKIDTKFWLYKRPNSTEPQLVHYGDALRSLKDTGFEAHKPVKMVIHGYKGSGKDVGAVLAARALVEKEDLSVVVVDWTNGAANSYASAVANTELVARQLGLLLLDMLSLGVDPGTVHLIGFSLGAHIAGCVGHDLLAHGNQLGRITGLDPASPLFKNQLLLQPSRKLDADDARFVDVLHTDGSPVWTEGFGLLRQTGHVDVFANGGREQPGCSDGRGSVIASHFDSALDITIACSHLRAWRLYLESLVSASGCRFTAYPCPAGAAAFLKGACFPSNNYCNTSAACNLIGVDAERLSGRGTLYLVTRASEPYCGEQLQVKILISEKTHRTRGILNLKLNHGNSSTSFQITYTLMDTVSGGHVLGALAAAEYGSMDPLRSPSVTATLSYQSLSFQTAPEADRDLPPPRIYLDEVVLSDMRGNSWSYCGRDTLLEDKHQTSIKLVTLTLTTEPCS